MMDSDCGCMSPPQGRHNPTPPSRNWKKKPRRIGPASRLDSCDPVVRVPTYLDALETPTIIGISTQFPATPRHEYTSHPGITYLSSVLPSPSPSLPRTTELLNFLSGSEYGVISPQRPRSSPFGILTYAPLVLDSGASERHMTSGTHPPLRRNTGSRYSVQYFL